MYTLLKPFNPHMHPQALLGTNKNNLSCSCSWTGWHHAITHRKQLFPHRHDLVLILYVFASATTTSSLARILTLQSLDRTCIAYCSSDSGAICALCSDWIWLMPLRWWPSYQCFCLSSCVLLNILDFQDPPNNQRSTGQAFSLQDCLFTNLAILYELVILFYLL